MEPTPAEPEGTKPDAAAPAATEPAVAEPTAENEPATTEPDTAEPTATEPSVTEPAVAEPTAEDEPATTEPTADTGPAAAEPGAVEPTAAGPATDEPSAAEAEATTEPEAAAEPEVTADPKAATEPEASEPEPIAEPELTAEGPSAEPATAEPATAEPATVEPAAAEPGAVSPPVPLDGPTPPAGIPLADVVAATANPSPDTGTGPSPATGKSSKVVGLLGTAIGFLAAFALVVLGLRGTAAAPPPASVESERAAKAFALARLGVANLADSWPADTAAALQIATYSLWRGLIGPASALVQARETMLVASAVSALLVWALVRRLGLSTPAAIAAAFLTALTPWAISAHRLIEPANLAVPWLLAGFLLSTPKTRRRIVAAPAALCLAVAVLTSPLVGVVLLAGLAASYAIGDAGERWSPKLRAVVVAALAAGAALLLATLAGTFGDALALPATVALPDPGPVDVALAIVAIVAALAGLRIRWLQPFALVFIVLAASAAVLPGPVRTPALLLALPAGSVLLAALGEAAVHWIADRWRMQAGGRRLATAGVAVVVLAAGGLAAAAAPSTYPGAEADGAVQASTWIQNNLGEDAVLVVDDVVWPELIQAGMPADRLVSYTGLGRDEGEPARLVRAALDGKAGAPPVFLVGRRTHGLATPAGELARTADQSSLPVARLGPGRRTEIRQVLPDANAAARLAGQEAKTRRAIGTELARNPGLVLDEGARRVLAAGEVDPRLLSVLAFLAARQRIGISAFGVTAGEQDIGAVDTAPLRRRARISSVDGVPISANAPSTKLLQRWLTAQLPPYRPASVTLDPGRGLTITYLAPSPTGLLAR